MLLQQVKEGQEEDDGHLSGYIFENLLFSTTVKLIMRNLSFIIHFFFLPLNCDASSMVVWVNELGMMKCVT